MKWLSVARWPRPEVRLGTHNNMSTDEHDTEGQARAVVHLLQTRGFGGEGKIFPVEAYVKPANEAVNAGDEIAPASSAQGQHCA